MRVELLYALFLAGWIVVAVDPKEPTKPDPDPPPPALKTDWPIACGRKCMDPDPPLHEDRAEAVTAT